jgi:peptidoglycan/LPS O-acetylase OafA/YrhL
VGLLRLLLALCVVAGHSSSYVFGFIPPIWSTFAVLVFFIISGFYMAMVLDGQYKGKPVRTFYLSRAARIYPAYWVSLAFTLMVSLYLTGTGFLGAFTQLSWVQQAHMVFANFFIFGQDLAYLFCLRDTTTSQCFVVDQVVLNSPAWSISVELMFYLIAPWAVHNLRSSAVLVGIGALYVLGITYLDYDALRAIAGISPHPLETVIRYHMFPASLLFFGGGAVAFHLIYKRHITGREKSGGMLQYAAAAAGVLLIANFTDPMIAWWQLLAFIVAVPSLFAFTRDNRFDRAIGELSYPVYILHFPILKMLSGFEVKGPFNYGTNAAILSILAGALVYLVIDRPVDRWRHRMVAKSAAAPKPGVTEGSIWTDKPVSTPAAG